MGRSEITFQIGGGPNLSIKVGQIRLTKHIEVHYLPLPYFSQWRDCTHQAILKKWFREAGRREFNLCGAHAEKVSELLWKAREYEKNSRSDVR
jgi:hypothetical protein